MLFSPASLALFVLVVAYTAWPTATIVIGAITFTVVALQYIVYGLGLLGRSAVCVGELAVHSVRLSYTCINNACTRVTRTGAERVLRPAANPLPVVPTPS